MSETTMEALHGQSLKELPDRVAASFSGKTVLLTGGTGFMGKVLLEKLLRMCPDIGGVVMLVRHKKGKDPKQRVEQIFKGELFTSLLECRGLEYLVSRTRAVSGDVSETGLALSEADRETCREANIIVHSAASVRFDEGLKKVVLLNTRGTRFMLELAKECTKLELFIHVSTAYCHPEVQVLEEQTYPSPADPHDIIKLAETASDEIIEVLTPKLLGVWPNTYAYSKALSEALVADELDNLPVVIIRPSVVIPMYKTPVPGWTDNINGPAGLLIAAGKGVLRTMYGDENNFADFIPVDIFANGVMICAWNFLVNGEKQYRVLNFTSSDEYRISWGELLQIGRNVVGTKIPFNYVAWYPGGSMTSIRLWHQIRVLLFHLLPGLLVDTLLFCLGFKPVLLRVHRRIWKGMEVFEYYTSNQWEFRSNVIRSVREHLNAREREDYKLDTIGFDTEKYLEVCTLALRRYILRESDESLPAARRHMYIMWCVDWAVKTIFCLLMMYWIYNWVFTSNVSNVNLLSIDNDVIIENKNL